MGRFAAQAGVTAIVYSKTLDIFAVT